MIGVVDVYRKVFVKAPLDKFGLSIPDKLIEILIKDLSPKKIYILLHFLNHISFKVQHTNFSVEDDIPALSLDLNKLLKSFILFPPFFVGYLSDKSILYFQPDFSDSFTGR